MTLSIRDAEADRLARELAALTGETMIEAIRTAPHERLERERKVREGDVERRRREIMEIVERFQRLPVLDDRSEDEMLGYDEHGFPT